MSPTYPAPSAIRVFVSSTFIDMQAERDLLVNEVFPDIRRRCAAIGIAFEAIDLRWGISGENTDAQVLDYCLEQIDNCVPYLFAIIGERYGWVPGERADLASMLDADERACSVTEIEIRRFERSVARADEPPRMLAALRAPTLTKAMGVEEPLSPQASERLSALRTRLKVKPDAFEYEDLAMFAERTTDFFLAAAEKLAAQLDTPARQIDAQQLRYLNMLRIPGVPQLPLRFVACGPQGDDKPISEQELAASLEDKRLHIVLGGPGSGKTMLSAALAARWAERNPQRRVLRLHIGATGELSLNGVLRDLYILADAGEPESWVEGLVAVLRTHARPTLIVLDGLERITGWDQTLPTTPASIAHQPLQLLETIEKLLSADARLTVLLAYDPGVCTDNAFGALLDEPEHTLRMDPYSAPTRFCVSRMLGLDEDVRATFAAQFFAFRGKHLTAEQASRIAHADNIVDFDTLYMACDRLRRFGDLHYDKQTQDAFVSHHIDDLFGQGQDAAIASIVRQARGALGLNAAKVDAVLSLLVISRYGVPATELIAMASDLSFQEVSMRDWALIEGMFGPFLVRSATRFQFKNIAVMRNVAVMLDRSIEERARVTLVDYLLARITQRALSGAFESILDMVSPNELVWQLRALPGHPGWRRLFDPLVLVAWFARDPEVSLIEFNAAFEASAFQLAYAEKSADFDEFAMISGFRKEAARFVSHANTATRERFEHALSFAINAMFVPEIQCSDRALLAARTATCALCAVKEDVWPGINNCTAAIMSAVAVLEAVCEERGVQAARGSPLRDQIVKWRAVAVHHASLFEGTPLGEYEIERIDVTLNQLRTRLDSA